MGGESNVLCTFLKYVLRHKYNEILGGSKVETL